MTGVPSQDPTNHQTGLSLPFVTAGTISTTPYNNSAFDPSFVSSSPSISPTDPRQSSPTTCEPLQSTRKTAKSRERKRGPGRRRHKRSLVCTFEGCNSLKVYTRQCDFE